tara:strand:- start:20 stop:541 length:522 start_codon:yes stop_codon:yes gene_type:complete
MPKTIPITKATDAQLRYYATTILGLDIHPMVSKRETILSKISAASDAAEITVPDEDLPDAPPARATQEQPTEIPAHDKPPVIVKIAITEAVDGEEAVPVSINGKAMLVPRGMWCEIPYPYYEGLRHAVEDRYEPLADGGMSTTPRQVSRYPFEVWVGDDEPREGVMRPPAQAA